MRTECCHFYSSSAVMSCTMLLTNNNVKLLLKNLYCRCLNHQKGIFFVSLYDNLSKRLLQASNNSCCIFQSVSKLMLYGPTLIRFMDLPVVALNVIHNALCMHFWCYRKIEQAYILHFPSPQEQSLLLVFSLRELIGLNVEEWSPVFFASLSYFVVGVMFAQKSLVLHCCCYSGGPSRSIGDRRRDNQDKDKPKKGKVTFATRFLCVWGLSTQKLPWVIHQKCFNLNETLLYH